MTQKTNVRKILVDKKSVTTDYIMTSTGITYDGLRGRISELRKLHNKNYRILSKKGLIVLEPIKKTIWQKILSLWR